MILDILHASTKKLLHTFEVSENDTIWNIKDKIYKADAKLYPERQSLRTETRGANLNDNDSLAKLNITGDTNKLYLRDLGPQIGWRTVFLAEYAGPFFIYFLFYLRPTLIYGEKAATTMPLIMHLSCLCYTGHFAKRLFETIYVHRFSHATMPIRNLFKNCTYYWLFAAFIAYYNNHPLYTEPSFGAIQISLGFISFVLSQIGNLSIHLAFKNMRPAGTKERKIPMPDSNPFTLLFRLVSCPNYTYEISAWFSYSLMTQSLPALFFTLAGFYQMTIWAIGKHKAYKKEFSNYPKSRRAIVPFLL